MHIVCDVDGVLANLCPAWYAKYNKDYNDNLTVDKVTHWDTDRFVKPECGKKIYDYLGHPDLYDKVEPLEGALEGVEILRTLGHTFTFATANARGMTDAKNDWLFRHGFIDDDFKRVWPAEVMVSNDKWRIVGDIIIEDKAQTVVEWVTRTGKPAVILTYPYNMPQLSEQPDEFFEKCFPVLNWAEIVEVVRGR